MPPMDIDSDSSSLSSAPDEEVLKLAPIFIKAKKATKLVAPPPVLSPPRPKRPPSPPHEDVLADNPDIAFIVMFRSRFSEAFPGKLAHFGPQDIERGVVDTHPSPQVESLLCALLGLVLNRKKPVERGHYGRALEEAVQTHKSQWPLKWEGQNPLHGGNDFNNMTPTKRLNLLRTLIMWSLNSSEAISDIIKVKYKQNRHNDDENQPLSVQPWGVDGDKRRFFLIQGQDDTSFRVYRENTRYTKNATWWSVAGEINEVKTLAEKLDKEDGTQAARRLSARMINAIPTFEATEEKRHRREYRQQRRAAFSRPEPGFGIYEGRTRGKRLRYTYDDGDGDDDEDDDSTNPGYDTDASLSHTRRSARNALGSSGRGTPFDAGLPTVTASGRQVRRPGQGVGYGESGLGRAVVSVDDLEDDGDGINGNGTRATRSGGVNGRKRKAGDEWDGDEELSDEEEVGSGDEWDSERNGEDEDEEEKEDVDMLDGESVGSDEDEEEPESYIVKLKVPGLGAVGKKDTSTNGEDAERKPDGEIEKTAEEGKAKMVNGLSEVVKDVMSETAAPIPQQSFDFAAADKAAANGENPPTPAPMPIDNPAPTEVKVNGHV